MFNFEMGIGNKFFEQKEEHMRKFNWPTTLATLVVAAVMVGTWLALQLPISIATITRSALLLYEPSDIQLVGATFVMLGGLSLMSVQVVAIVEELSRER